MEMCFRWFGKDDPVRLDYIRQIPGVKGIVSAVYDVPAGQAWPLASLLTLKNTVEAASLKLSVIESIPVHEDIKLGAPDRDKFIDAFIESLKAVGRAGLGTVCYNFMPVFDWLRTELAMQRPDGSAVLSYSHKELDSMDPSGGELELPGWDSSYTKEELQKLMTGFKALGKEGLWKNLEYFLKAVVPEAEAAGVKLAIHPDDPPWPVFGLPRIITDKAAMERLLKIVDSPYNGLTLCTGSLGVSPDNKLADMAESFASLGRINFVHCRNVKITGYRSFEESAHLSEDGSLDMVGIMASLYGAGYDGPMRPDHGRMIWGEEGRPGYGLYDRALGAVYINGIWDALKKSSLKQGC